MSSMLSPTNYLIPHNIKVRKLHKVFPSRLQSCVICCDAEPLERFYLQIQIQNELNAAFGKFKRENATLKAFQSIALCCGADGDGEQQSVETAQQKCDKGRRAQEAKCIGLPSRRHIRQTQQPGRTAI